MDKASSPGLGCCARHGERACPRCFDLPVAQADVEAVIDLFRGAERTGAVPFGEARDTERHFQLFRPRVFTLRCVVGGVAKVSALAGELVERFEARLTAAGSGQVSGEQGPGSGPCSGSAPPQGPSDRPCSPGQGPPAGPCPAKPAAQGPVAGPSRAEPHEQGPVAGPRPAEPDEQGPVAGPSKALSVAFAHDVALFTESTFTGRWANPSGGRPEEKEEPS